MPFNGLAGVLRFVTWPTQANTSARFKTETQLLRLHLASAMMQRHVPLKGNSVLGGQEKSSLVATWSGWQLQVTCNGVNTHKKYIKTHTVLCVCIYPHIHTHTSRTSHSLGQLFPLKGVRRLYQKPCPHFSCQISQKSPALLSLLFPLHFSSPSGPFQRLHLYSHFAACALLFEVGAWRGKHVLPFYICGIK